MASASVTNPIELLRVLVDLACEVAAQESDPHGSQRQVFETYGKLHGARALLGNQIYRVTREEREQLKAILHRVSERRVREGGIDDLPSL